MVGIPVDPRAAARERQTIAPGSAVRPRKVAQQLMSLAAPQSAGRCLAARPSASSAEAPQATTTARVNTGEKPRRLARVTIRRGPCRRTSASAMTRLTGGVRSVAGIGARIETQPFPGWFGKRGCSRTRPRDAGRSIYTSRPSAYDPSGQMEIWQYPFEPMRDISLYAIGEYG